MTTLDYQINEHVHLFFFRKKKSDLSFLFDTVRLLFLKFQDFFSIVFEKKIKIVIVFKID